MHSKTVEIIRETLKEKGSVTLPITTDSMSPWIPVGSNIIVSRKSNKGVFSTVAFGDVLLCDLGDSLLCHRCIGRKNIKGSSFYIIKGDRNRKADEIIAQDKMLGIVKSIQIQKKLNSGNSGACSAIARLSISIFGLCMPFTFFWGFISLCEFVLYKLIVKKGLYRDI